MPSEISSINDNAEQFNKKQINQPTKESKLCLKEDLAFYVPEQKKHYENKSNEDTNQEPRELELYFKMYLWKF